MPNRIRKETDDLIILDESPWIILGIVLGLWLIIFLWRSVPPTLALILTLVLIIGISVKLFWLLYNESVTADKKVQKIIIKNSFDNKEIPFSDIKRTEIKEVNYDEGTSWKIYIVTTQGYSIKILDTYNKSDAIVAEKISKITNSEIIHDANFTQLSHPQASGTKLNAKEKVNFTLELSEFELRDGEVCPACAGKIRLLEPHRDRKGGITHYDAECIRCGLKGEVINGVF